MSVRGYDCSCLCSSCEFEQCLFRKVGLVPFSLKSVLRDPSTASTLDRDPPPPVARGQVIVHSKATAGGLSPGVRVSHESVSAVAFDNCCYGELKPWSGVGLEAGALAGGVIGAHYLGLGHHAVLLLREGITVCGERREE